jgi:NAD(P)-dependent dehydrogenase (short-subunit alcohol dehydrogenase family)
VQLKDKNAIIYGGGGAVGGAVAKAFAREGAKVFLAGRTLARVQAVADEIGDSAQAAEVDALDEVAIERHFASTVEKVGRLDISFNAVGIRNTKLQGTALTDLDVEQFSSPIATYTRSYFLTSRIAARHMIKQKSGVIMTVTSSPSRAGIPMMGGVGPAMSAIEGLVSLVCGPWVCQTRARSKRSMGFTPKHGELPASSSPASSPAELMPSACRHFSKWQTWRPLRLPIMRAQ